MRLSIAGSLAICLASAQAFKNTSPLFLVSTSNNIPLEETKQLQSNDDVLKTTFEFLDTCPSKHYLLVSQESVNVADYTSPRAVPFLRRAMKNERVQSVLNVAEVVDQSTTDAIQALLQKKCDADLEIYEGTDTSVNRTDFSKPGADSAKITRINFKGLPSEEPKRSSLLADFDSSLAGLLEKLQHDPDYTIIYTTTPVSAETHANSYDPTFQTPLNVELKRRSEVIEVQRSEVPYLTVRDSNSTSAQPLFEKYQFLSPGIFMGIITVLVLLAILSVGISAISGLQVSYGAFDKEMGPAASKKS